VSRFDLRVAPSAARSLERLPEPVAAAVVGFLTGPLLDEPCRVGRPLVRQLTGYWSARRGAYRVVYAIDEPNLLVLVVRIEHRADVYRPLAVRKATRYFVPPAAEARSRSSHRQQREDSRGALGAHTIQPEQRAGAA